MVKPSLEDVAIPIQLPADPTQKLTVRVLYIFAGKARHADVGDWLRSMSILQQFELFLVEIDLLRPGGPGVNDVLDEEVWGQLIAQMSAGLFDVLVITPPCNTFSRARFANYSPTSRPLRTKQWPWGFPWLEGRSLAACQLGNEFLRKTLQALRLAKSLQMGALCEHPEDLGATSDGSLPGSIWAMEETFSLVAELGAETAALFQCWFLAATSKATRLLALGIKLTDPEGHKLARGWPQFNDKGEYRGPLPRRCGHSFHRPLIGHDASGGWRTTAAAAYPPAMCRWLAMMIVSFCINLKMGQISLLQTVAVRTPTLVPHSSPALLDQVLGAPAPETETPPADTTSSRSSRVKAQVPTQSPPTSDEDEDGVTRPLLRDFPGGTGPPLASNWGGKIKAIHDGGGLCSPGRWSPESRRGYEWDKLPSLRESLIDCLRRHIPDHTRLCFELATGKVKQSPFSEPLLEEARALWFSSLTREGMDDCRLKAVPEFQPFFLPALAETLKQLGDPDWRIFDEAHNSFSKGVPVGMGERLPRTPAVFPRKTKWRK